jgi:ATP-dependent RNA helicase RhlE
LTFEQLGLIEPILKALKTEGYKTPTPIQERAIPVVLERKDLLGCAQTGTGKTAAFAIPILQILFNEAYSHPGTNSYTRTGNTNK